MPKSKNDSVVTKSVLDASLKDAVEDISAVITDFAGHVDERFNKVESRLENVETSVESMNVRLDSVETSVESMNVRLGSVETSVESVEVAVKELNEKYDYLITTIDKFVKRIDQYETENVARDAHLARLERWMHQIADKVGVNLK